MNNSSLHHAIIASFLVHFPIPMRRAWDNVI